MDWAPPSTHVWPFILRDVGTRGLTMDHVRVGIRLFGTLLGVQTSMPKKVVNLP